MKYLFNILFIILFLCTCGYASSYKGKEKSSSRDTFWNELEWTQEAVTEAARSVKQAVSNQKNKRKALTSVFKRDKTDPEGRKSWLKRLFGKKKRDPNRELKRKKRLEEKKKKKEMRKIKKQYSQKKPWFEWLFGVFPSVSE